MRVPDITGAHDGSVSVREWGADNPVAVPRPSGTYAKVRLIHIHLPLVLQVVIVK